MDDDLDLGEPVLVDFTKHPIWIGGAKAARRELLDALEAEISALQVHRPLPSGIPNVNYDAVLAIIAKHREES